MKTIHHQLGLRRLIYFAALAIALAVALTIAFAITAPNATAQPLTTTPPLVAKQPATASTTPAKPAEAAIKNVTRPKIGLVLSGGGARGAAHVGVIKVLEEMRIPIDFIAGTSIGALVGAAYASGTPIKELEERLNSADWDDLFTDNSPRADRSFLRKEDDQARLLKFETGVKKEGLVLPPGAIAGQKLDILFSKITRGVVAEIDFNRLPIPFRAVATEAESGRMVVFSEGRLPDVMRASMSVPGAVTPYQIDNRIFLDGGLTRNLPVDVARQMGADIVIAVNLGTPLLKRSELSSLVGISLQMINILTEQNVRSSLDSLDREDMLISPELDKISSTDFGSVSPAIAAGETAARAIAARLAEYSIGAPQYAQIMQQRGARLGRAVRVSDTIDQVRITGNTLVSQVEIERALEVKVGEAASFDKVNRGISRIYGLGHFERVNYSLLNEPVFKADGSADTQQVLTINTREKPWGPDYLRFGVSLAADSVGEGSFNLLMRYQRTQLNKYGAEWRTDIQVGRDAKLATQLFQPFTQSAWFNVIPYAEIERRPLNIFAEGQRVARYDLTSSSFGVDLGADLGRNSIARFGLTRGNNTASLNIGSLIAPNFKYKQGGLRLKLVYDSLDDAAFPRDGRTASLNAYTSTKTLSATSAYTKVEALYNENVSFGPHTFSVGLRLGQSGKGEVPLFDQYALGGFLQLSGYRPGELLGQSVAFSRLSYYRQIDYFKNPFGKRLFIGASAESGRASDSFQSLSSGDTKSSFGLFAGFDTVLGPLYLGYGRAKGRDTIFYFFLGQP